MAEYPNQSQPNQGLRPDGAPCIQPLLLSTYLLSSPEDGLSGLSSFLIMIFPGQSFVAPPQGPGTRTRSTSSQPSRILLPSAPPTYSVWRLLGRYVLFCFLSEVPVTI